MCCRGGVADHHKGDLYSNYVLVERMAAGTIRSSGLSNLKDGPVNHYAPPQSFSMDRAIEDAEAWADENGVSEIFILDADRRGPREKRRERLP